MKKIAVISLLIAILTLLVPMTLNFDIKPSGNEKKEKTSASQEADENKELVTIFSSEISFLY